MGWDLVKHRDSFIFTIRKLARGPHLGSPTDRWLLFIGFYIYQ